MTTNTDGHDETFALAPQAGAGGGTDAGGAQRSTARRQEMVRGPVANPDDPPISVPRRDRDGGMTLPGPDYAGTPGRIAIVQGQVYLVGVILVAQLFLVTTALFELLSGHTDKLWWIALVSLVGFLLALAVALWPRRRISSY
jgi:hypothetical protein